MRTVEVHSHAARPRTGRLWIVETLVVLGVLAFGYFAVTMDGSSFTSQVPAEAPLDPLLELTR